MKYGYVSARTEEQHADIQIDALRKYGVDKIIEDIMSAGKRRRPQLQLLLSKLRTGDSLVVYELKRLGRNAKQLLALAENLKALGVDFVSITEQIDTTTSTGRIVFAAWRVLAQLDRDIISESKIFRLTAARAEGRGGGRRPHDKERIEAALKMYSSNEYSIQEIQKLTGLSRSSIYKYLRLYGYGKSVLPKNTQT